MGCIASKEASADAAAEKPSRKSLAKGNITEVSTKALGTNCEAGHPLDKYDVLDTLGTGGFAVGKRVRSKKTGENFAMKIINVNFDEDAVSVDRLEVVRSPSKNPDTRLFRGKGIFCHPTRSTFEAYYILI